MVLKGYGFLEKINNNMESNKLRETFLNFFISKNHKIVNSAPLVIKNDPTLMFTNAGMNQFKDIFLAYSEKQYTRVSDSQKCLRVSGKHNDLEEVGHDTYHHTMFEMLGNWSFGDYYKKEAIEWAWEFLHDILKIDKDKIYATVFEGDKKDGTKKDMEAYNLWKQFLPENQIIDGNKKDNFWEMGEQGPCGACSEVHVDIRTEEERKKIEGKDLINKDHPEVIEIWNLVFIEYNRKANGELEQLPEKHIDTGMGFERLCMVTQGVRSNYDTDNFQVLISELSKISGYKYGEKEETDIALRVISDHLRAVAFSIADGQLPSNNGAGYVIRRILRRAIRYGYTFLGMKSAFIYKMLPALQSIMAEAYPELIKEGKLISKVIQEEENSFFRTLETGIRLLDNIIIKCKNNNTKIIDGKVAFELYDTYGFPYDLSELIARENNLEIDEKGYKEALSEQKNRSKKAGETSTSDWVEISNNKSLEFTGYKQLEENTKIVKYRKVNQKSKDLYQLVLSKTPFYAESGGQAGDKGIIINSDKKEYKIINTIKENNLSIHICNELPENIEQNFVAKVFNNPRKNTESNHTATHLLHYALREVLGNHVEQKGSLVNTDGLRFDFSHFEKLSTENIEAIEKLVNNQIRANHHQNCKEVSMDEAEKIGAIALFGEKYGDKVRVVKFGNSVELCGGTHVSATGNIGLFKITSESAIAAGIRRIEAITSEKAEIFTRKESAELKQISSLFNSPKNIFENVEKLIEEKNILSKEIEKIQKERTKQIKKDLLNSIEKIGNINLISANIEIDNSNSLKDLAFQLKGEIDNLILIIGANIKGKPQLLIMFADNIVEDKKLDAGKIVREAAKEIKGGGGGQKFFATAGGKDISGIDSAIKKSKELIF